MDTRLMTINGRPDTMATTIRKFREQNARENAAAWYEIPGLFVNITSAERAGSFEFNMIKIVLCTVHGALRIKRAKTRGKYFHGSQETWLHRRNLGCTN